MPRWSAAKREAFTAWLLRKYRGRVPKRMNLQKEANEFARAWRGLAKRLRPGQIHPLSERLLRALQRGKRKRAIPKPKSKPRTRRGPRPR